jgi:hypothetical protein
MVKANLTNLVKRLIIAANVVQEELGLSTHVPVCVCSGYKCVDYLVRNVLKEDKPFRAVLIDDSDYNKPLNKENEVLLTPKFNRFSHENAVKVKNLLVQLFPDGVISHQPDLWTHDDKTIFQGEMRRSYVRNMATDRLVPILVQQFGYAEIADVDTLRESKTYMSEALYDKIVDPDYESTWSDMGDKLEEMLFPDEQPPAKRIRVDE